MKNKFKNTFSKYSLNGHVMGSLKFIETFVTVQKLTKVVAACSNVNLFSFYYKP